jgi:transposase
MKKSVKFSPEVQERGVRMVVEAQGQHDSLWTSDRTHACRCSSKRVDEEVRRSVP